MSAPASVANVNITLPDGKVMTFARGVTGSEIAAAIGPGLAKAALILEVDGKQWDLFRPIEHDANIRIITKKDPEALELIRHDAAHVLAMAVQELFPGTQVTIGPAIEDGFYYDFARDTPFTPEDLPKIEDKMREIIRRDLPTRREVWQRDKAVAHFKDMGETYKAELIESIPQGEDVSIYWHGDWHDLCRGPHFATTGKIGDAFKLTKIAGAYWRGDAKNAQLAAHLRHGMARPERSSTPISSCSKSRRSATTAVSAATCTSSPSHPTSAPGCRCGCPTAW